MVKIQFGVQPDEIYISLLEPDEKALIFTPVGIWKLNS